MIGVHAPAINAINDHVVNAPLLGIGTLRGEPDSELAGVSTTVPFEFRAPMSGIGQNANMGLEFQWLQSRKNVFFMGASTWEGVTRGMSSGQLPMQGSLRAVRYDRRVKLSYNEFYFGWRRNFSLIARRFQIYTRVSLNEVFDIDYRDENVYTIMDEGDLNDVKRIINVNGQATGVAMLLIGLGGEYFFSRNISLGFDAGYAVNERPFQFKNSSFQTDLRDGDGIQVFTPTLPVTTTAPTLGYVNENETATAELSRETVVINELKLRLDGWKFFFRVNIYY